MTTTEQTPAHGADGLCDRWRASSLDSIWLRPADWYHPAVEPLAVAVAGGTDALTAAQDLGRARGDVGVGIGESLDDLACLYAAAELGPPPHQVVRALAEGWADAQAGVMVDAGALDADSGLPTRQYLAVRLAETYGEAARLGIDPSDRHGLTLVDAAVGTAAGFLRSAREAAVGAALRATFGPGHPMATLGGGMFAVLVRHDDDLPVLVDRLRREIARRCAPLEVAQVTRHPVRVWAEPLPLLHEDAVARLGRMARPPA